MRSATKFQYASSRVASIDAARGGAMLFVCLAHFANAYHFVSGADATGGYLVMIGMIASPTFVTVSGLVAGFLAITRSRAFGELRLKLIDRGFFLLIIGHVVLAVSGIFTGPGFGHACKIGYITDVVGFAVVLGPSLIASLKPSVRLLLAAAVFTCCWLAVFIWHPTGGLAAVAKQYLIGVPNLSDSTRGDFPLLPWFAVYLVGTVIGQQLGRYYSQRNERGAHLMLAKLGVSSLALGVAAKLGLHALRTSLPALDQTHHLLLFSISSYQKFPPGPVYLVFFGGAGMLLVSAILEAGRRGTQRFLLNQLRQIGSASLFVYVLQFYLYGVVLRALRLPYSLWWPLLFLFTIIILAKAAALWNARDGNRFLTVGLGAVLKWNERRKRPTLTKQIGLDASLS